MTNEELVSRINDGIDTGENMIALYVQMKGAIYQIAGKYSGYAELDDLAQEGYIGLCHAVSHYDAANGANFASYAWKCIQGHMLRYIQKDSCLPIYLQELMGRYKKLCNIFLQEHGRKPADREIMLYLDISPEQVGGLKKSLHMEHMASLDSPVNSEEDISLGDTVVGDAEMEQDIIGRVDEELLKEILWDAVDGLPDQQSEVIRMRYQEQKTLQEIGERLGVPRSRARQMEQKGLRALRMPEYFDLLLPFRDDYITQHAYKGCGYENFDRTWTSSTERVALDLLEKSESN